MKKLISEANYYYIAGFFLTVDVASMEQIAKHSSDGTKPLRPELTINAAPTSKQLNG